MDMYVHVCRRMIFRYERVCMDMYVYMCRKEYMEIWIYFMFCCVYLIVCFYAYMNVQIFVLVHLINLGLKHLSKF